jgi:hypothetical protein
MVSAGQGDKAVIVEPGKTYIGKVRATSSQRDTLAMQLRLSSMLAALHLQPPGLPQSAILCIRSLSDPLPGALHPRNHDTRPLYAWEQAVRTSLKRLVEQAMYPARDAIPANANAVIFTDQAEMLACLAKDWCVGSIAGCWWWQGLFAGKDLNQVLVPTWLHNPEYIPAALQHLAAMGKAITFARALGDNYARSLTQSMIRSFGLYELQTHLESFAQKSISPEPVPAASPPLQAPPPALNRHARNARRASIVQEAYPHHAIPASQDLPTLQDTLHMAPWHHWSPEGNADELSLEQQCLLGIGLMLVRAPTVVRSPSFARAMSKWLFVTSPSIASDAPPIEKIVGASSSLRQLPMQTDSLAASAREGRAYPDHVSSAQQEASIIASDGKSKSLEAIHESRQKLLDPSETTVVAEFTAFAELVRESRQVSTDGTSTLGGRDVMNQVLSTGEQAETIAEAAQESAALQLAATEPPHVEQKRPEAVELLETEFETELGGLFYLINLGLFLHLYGDFTTPLQPGISLGIWDFITLLGQQLVDEQDDPAWLFLVRMAGHTEQEPAGREFDPPHNWRIPEEWLLPFSGEGEWRWNVSRRRLRVQHPERFLVLDVRVNGADPTEQVRREMQAYTEMWNARARLVHGPLRRGRRRVQPVNTSPRVKRWLRWMMPYIQARLQRALGLGSVDDIPRVLLRQRASIISTATHLDIVLLLAALPIEVRISGLDRNPGWVPAAGRFVTFQFE